MQSRPTEAVCSNRCCRYHLPPTSTCSMVRLQASPADREPGLVDHQRLLAKALLPNELQGPKRGSNGDASCPGNRNPIPDKSPGSTTDFRQEQTLLPQRQTLWKRCSLFPFDL